MAGTIIADKIQTENAFLTLNVGQTLVATINSSGILNSSGGTMVGANGSVSNTAITGLVTASQIANVANTQITGVITASQIATVANTQLTGNITSSQITSNPTLYGNVSVTGVIGVGGATTSTSGSGISFPATQSASTDANTLDDYEEGTWTPTLTGGTTNPTVTYGQRNAAYTKIGNVVTLFFRFQTTAISGGSGTAQISGLPFASNDTYRNGGALGYVSNITFGAGFTQAGLYNNPSSAVLAFTLSGTGQGATEATISAIGATLDVVVTYTYRV